MVSMLGMFRSFHVQIDLGRKEFLWRSVFVYIHAKQKQPGCKKVRGQSEATMVISDQNLCYQVRPRS